MINRQNDLRRILNAATRLSSFAACIWLVQGWLVQDLPVGQSAKAETSESEGATPDASWLKLSPEVQVSELTAAQYAGAVSAAKEAMQQVYGDMTASEKQSFLKEWSQLFDYPCQEVLDYLVKLNPLLGRYLTIRGAMASTAAEFDAAWNESLTCGTLQFEDGIREALAIAHLKQQTLVALSDAMGKTVDEIFALGPPPDVNALRGQARRRHRAAIRTPGNYPGAPLEGEWVGDWHRHSTGEQKGLGGSDKFLDLLKDTITQHAEEEGETLVPDCHLLLTSVHGDSDDQFRLHVYNFDDLKSIPFLRKQQQADQRLLGNEKQCKEWLHSFRNILLPSITQLKEAEYQLEYESRQMLDWKSRWVWDFEIDGTELIVNERGYLRTYGVDFIDDQPDWFDEGGPGQLFSHRSARLKRPAKPSPIPPAEWSMEQAYEAEEVPEAAWVLKDVQVDEFPKPGGKRVQVDRQLGTAELLLPQLPPAAPTKVTFRWTPLPERIMRGDKIVLNYSFQQTSGRLRGTNLFMSDLGLGLTIRKWPQSYTAEESRSAGVKRELFVPSLPFIADQIDTIYVTSGGDFAVAYVYVRVPAEKVHETIIQKQPPVDKPKKPDPQALEQQRRQEQINFHRECIRLIEINLQRDVEELERTKDDGNRKILLSRIMNNEHNIYSEMDRIREIETGQFVHTRTPIDEMYKARWEQSIADKARAVIRAHRLYEGLQRLPNNAPADQRDELRAFIHRQVDARTAISGDVAKLEKVVSAVGNRIQGHWEAEAATSLEESLEAAVMAERCERVRYLAAAELTVFTLGTAEVLPMIIYQAGCGFVETEGSAQNRFWEATKRGLSWYNQATFVASEAMNGYDKGGWIGDNKGTVWGAIERAGESFLLVKGFEYFGFPPTKAERQAYVKQQFDKARRDQSVADAKSLLNDYQRTYTEYQRVLAYGGSTAEVLAMEKLLQQKATSIAATHEAKLILKKFGSEPRFVPLVNDYNQRMEQVYVGVRERFRQNMQSRNYEHVDDWHLQDIRNSSSAGTVNMDHDIAIIDRAPRTGRTESLTKSKSESLAPFVRRKGGNSSDWSPNTSQSTTPPTSESRLFFYQRQGNVSVRVSPIRFEKDAAKAWQEAFQSTTGYSGRLAGETMTTRTASSEAYMDLAWLGSESSKRALISDISAGYAAQAGDVTIYKASEIAASGNLTELQKMMEMARGASKDINTKLLPVVEESSRIISKSNSVRALKIDQIRKHWKQIGEILATAVDDPIGADRELRILTGNRGLTQVINDARETIANFGKFVGK